MESHRRDWGLIVWMLFAMLVVFLLTAIGAAWAVRHALLSGQRFTDGQRHLVLTVAEFPGLVRDSLLEFQGIVDNSPAPLLLDRRATEKPEWIRRFPAPDDPGFLLFSGLDPATRRSGIKLIRISDGTVIAQWKPDWDAILRLMTNKWKGNPFSARAIHPLLLSDGDIVFNTLNSMVRLGPCDGRPIWVLDQAVHHSNELDDEGTIWTAGISIKGFEENDWLRDRVRDDAILRVSQDGKILERYSLASILRANGFGPYLLGMSGLVLQTDPIHLNEVRMAPRDTPYWKRGDLLLSARHLSSVFLYRPSTGKIVWHKTGPWMNQHDAEFLDDHRISIFDNNVFGGAPKEQPFVVKGDLNRVYIYDFSTREETQPYAALLAQARPTTLSEGRARVLPDGGLFIEESNFGRILRFTPERLLWSFVNDYDAKHIGLLSWSRYLTPEEAAPALKALADKQCPVRDKRR